MFKRFGKLFLTTVIVFMFCCSAMIGQSFAHNKQEISVRIIGTPAFQISGVIPASSNSNALSALLDFAKSKNISVKVKDTAYGPYVFQIDGIAEKVNTATSGWNFWVNGNSAEASADQTNVQAGDEVVWALSDWGVTLFPKLQYSLSTQQQKVQTVDLNQPFLLTVQAEQTTYDENWNPSTSVVPIAHATVEIRTATTRSVLQSDSNGQLQLLRNSGEPFAIQVSKFDTATLVPTLVPSGWTWFTVNSQSNAWQDVKSTDWAFPCIQLVTSKGWLSAKQPNRFAPQVAVTLADAIQTFGTFKGFNSLSNWTDVAVANQWIDAASTKPALLNKALTRGQLATILTKLLGEKYPTPAIYATFKDEAQFIKNKELHAAILQVAATGLMNGYKDRSFRANQSVTRAEFAHVLRLLNDLGLADAHE
jgi:Domain of unknown function (DUF4430)/S-layer homology domain